MHCGITRKIDTGTALPLNQYIEGVELVSLRSSLFDNKGRMGVLPRRNRRREPIRTFDGGSFVFDYDGIRWACEIPHEDYNIGGYVSGTASKNTYYRVRAEGHNTLVIDPDESAGRNLTVI